MPRPDMEAAEVGRLGDEIYERDIRAVVEPEHTGKFLALDIATGDYEIDTDEVAAIDRLIARHPEGARYLLRVGYPYAHEFGGSSFRILSEEPREDSDHGQSGS